MGEDIAVEIIVERIDPGMEQLERVAQHPFHQGPHNILMEKILL